jgi:hypothetical protein
VNSYAYSRANRTGGRPASRRRATAPPHGAPYGLAGDEAAPKGVADQGRVRLRGLDELGAVHDGADDLEVPLEEGREALHDDLVAIGH